MFVVKLKKKYQSKVSHLVYVFSFAFFYYKRKLLLLYMSLTTKFQCFLIVMIDAGLAFKLCQLHLKSQFTKCDPSMTYNWSQLQNSIIE